MYCENCGAKLPEGSKFCENCGTKVEAENAAPTAAAYDAQTETAQTTANIGKPVGGSGNILLCPDGKYRWIYELPMMRNPVVLFTVWKVMAISVAVPALVVFFSDLSDGFIEALVPALKVYALVMGIVIVLSLIAYTIVAATYGWKYIVLFTMDEDGIVHAQQEKQFKKAEAMGWLTAFAGAAGNSLTTTGAGLLAATKSSMASEFKNVSTVIGRRGMNTIKVNQLFAKNQVYVDRADYDFVWEYITARCKKAKIR